MIIHPGGTGLFDEFEEAFHGMDSFVPTVGKYSL
jgi:hypothetical protein